MRLARFINENMERILVEWDAFASTLRPAADVMSAAALRDHAGQILRAVALDMEAPWNPGPPEDSGAHRAPAAKQVQSAAAIHGAMRQASDFTMLQLSAEYRVLRATVQRLWLPRVDEPATAVLWELIRFNDAIDQAMAESIVTFSARSEYTGDLFLAVLGHDLRAPLATMSLSGNLLAQAGVAPDQIGQIAARISRSARVMSAMVEDLLGYTRSQLGSGISVTRAPADVAVVCRSSIDDAKAAYPGSEFDFHASGDLEGMVDSVKLQQLLTNLLANAAQYGSRERPVRVAAVGDAGAITLRVTNHGPVIPQDSLGSIFKPLVQLPAADEAGARPQSSLGLGLFVAREIAIAHLGTIEVTSDEVNGTTFSVRLPRAPTV